MPDLAEVYYDGLRQQISRVLDLLGPDRVEKGLTAFEDGASTWSHCFFARALAPEVLLHGEEDVARALGLTNPTAKNGLNLVPVRIVYRTFDGCSSWMSKEDLRQMIRDLQAEQATTIETAATNLETAKAWLEKSKQNVNNALKKINFMGVESTPVKLGGPSCAT